MSLPFPEASSFDASGVGGEFLLLDMQLTQSRQLQTMGLHGSAIVKLVSSGMYPEAMNVSSCVYENRQPSQPDVAFGGVALLGRDGQNVRPYLLGRMHVYSRFPALVLPTANFTQAEAEATAAMATELRGKARKLGVILCPWLIEVFRTPVPGQPRTNNHGQLLR